MISREKTILDLFEKRVLPTIQKDLMGIWITHHEYAIIFESDKKRSALEEKYVNTYQDELEAYREKECAYDAFLQQKQRGTKGSVIKPDPPGPKPRLQKVLPDMCQEIVKGVTEEYVSEFNHQWDTHLKASFQGQLAEHYKPINILDPFLRRHGWLSLPESFSTITLGFVDLVLVHALKNYLIPPSGFNVELIKKGKPKWNKIDRAWFQEQLEGFPLRHIEELYINTVRGEHGHYIKPTVFTSNQNLTRFDLIRYLYNKYKKK